MQLFINREKPLVDFTPCAAGLLATLTFLISIFKPRSHTHTHTGKHARIHMLVNRYLSAHVCRVHER